MSAIAYAQANQVFEAASIRRSDRLDQVGDLGIQPAAPSVAPVHRGWQREQLGLKLEAARGPAEVLVIESVSRPTDN